MWERAFDFLASFVHIADNDSTSSNLVSYQMIIMRQCFRSAWPELQSFTVHLIDLEQLTIAGNGLGTAQAHTSKAVLTERFRDACNPNYPTSSGVRTVNI